MELGLIPPANLLVIMLLSNNKGNSRKKSQALKPTKPLILCSKNSRNPKIIVKPTTYTSKKSHSNNHSNHSKVNSLS